MRNFALTVLAASSALLVASSARAAILYDAGGFEGFATGTIVGQVGGTGLSAANPWQRVGGTDAAYSVAGTTNKTLVLSNGGTGGSFAFPDVSYTPSTNEVVSVATDIAASDPTLTATDNTGFFVDIFANNAAGNRIGRYGLSISANQIKVSVVTWFNSTTGQFVPAQATTSSSVNVFSVSVTTALTAATFYNFDARINFDTKTWDLYSGGQLFIGGLAFANTTSVNATILGIGDADASVSSVTGGTNTGAIDNYVVSTIMIPEPSSMALLAPAGLLLARRRRA